MTPGAPALQLNDAAVRFGTRTLWEQVSLSLASGEFLAVLGVLGQFHVWAPIAIEAPLAQVGGAGCGWSGQLASMTLSSEA